MARATIEERKASIEKEYREQIKKLETIGHMEDMVEEWITDLEDKIEDAHNKWVKVGQEEEQAVDENGELLWVTKDYYWRGTPTSKVPEDEKDTVTPYYKAIYGNRRVEYSELSDYEQSLIDGYRNLKAILEKLEF